MSTELLQSLMRQTDALTADEQLRLMAYLAEKARAAYAGAQPRRRWRDIRGLAKPSLFGKDAQAHISRTRQEDTERRERSLRG